MTLCLSLRFLIYRLSIAIYFPTWISSPPCTPIILSSSSSSLASEKWIKNTSAIFQKNWSTGEEKLFKKGFSTASNEVLIIMTFWLVSLMVGLNLKGLIGDTRCGVFGSWLESVNGSLLFRSNCFKSFS